MSEKYPLQRIITNDLYLAAYLMCAGAALCHLEHNGRRRVSFVLAGENVQRLRDEYESGTVRLNVRSFRDSLLTVRRKMDTEQRSESHGSTRLTTSVQNRNRLQVVPQY